MSQHILAKRLRAQTEEVAWIQILTPPYNVTSSCLIVPLGNNRVTVRIQWVSERSAVIALNEYDLLFFLWKMIIVDISN